MEGKHMVAHTSEIMGNNQSLDKDLKDINTKIDNNKDGTLIASATTLGNVKIGDNISVTDEGTISVPVAASNTYGVVKVSDPTPSYHSYNPNVISIIEGELAVRTASKDNLGVVKVGDGLEVNQGAISVKNSICVVEVDKYAGENWAISEDEDKYAEDVEQALANGALLYVSYNNELRPVIYYDSDSNGITLVFATGYSGTTVTYSDVLLGRSAD